MKDKNGKEITSGCQVDVPEGNPQTDTHTYEFRGTVIDIYDDTGTVVVRDQADDEFEIEGNRVEVVED